MISDLHVMNLEDKIAKNSSKLLEDNIIEPYINNNYVCKTCGNIGKSHPETSMCFVCGDDNWYPVEEEIAR